MRIDQLLTKLLAERPQATAAVLHHAVIDYYEFESLDVRDGDFPVLIELIDEFSAETLRAATTTISLEKNDERSR